MIFLILHVNSKYKMKTVTVEIKKESALKALQKMENENSIRILANENLDIPSLPGKPLSVTEFKAWVNYAESTPSVSFKEAKAVWKKKRKTLGKNTI
jgi:hypothetical protein